MEKFIISKNENGEFKFDFTDKKNKVILSSGAYIRKAMCIHGIGSVKRSSQDTSKFERNRSLDNEPYFKLKSFNGKVIGVSKIFADRESRNNVIEFVKEWAVKAVVEDRSLKR